jgi:mono/diheme cytochrome c family protein
MGAAFSGLWIHDAVGVFITPLATAIFYFVIPAVTRKPIYSHFYSMIGFWLLFLVYPLNGIHHYVYSSLPMSAQHASEIASIYQGIDVIIVVTNLLLSISLGGGGLVARDLPLRFVWTGIVIYLTVSIQGASEAVMAFNSFTHFTDFVIGHSHLAMIGFASFAAMGGLAHLWRHMPGMRWNQRALAWSYWLLVVGLGLMVLDLTAAGLVQGSLWQQHLPWIESVRASQPYWVFRSVDGCLLLAGFVVYGISFFTGERNRPAEVAVISPDHHAPSERPASMWIGTAYGATFGAGLLFFVVSFLALGVYPAIRLHARMVQTTPPGAQLALTPQERRGQEIYGRDGCAYCHTEQVRFTPADAWRFGHPTEAWETQGEFPQLWGTRRIGPDLARESGKRPADWQLAHLYNPRYVVPDSMMPGYTWLFRGDASKPSQDALDVVAYLNTLGRAALQAATPHGGTASLMDARFIASMPQATNDLEEGRAVYMANCSGCHGVDGRAHSPGGRALRPVAFDLADFRLRPASVWKALQNGVQGTAMPAWNELPGAEFKAVGDYVLALSSTPELRPEEQRAPTQTLLLAGQRVFDTHCVRCHGESGGGDGPEADRYHPRPLNFQGTQVSYSGAAQVIHDGVPGSGMPAWPLLTPAEIQAVTYYMRSLYQGPVVPARPMPTASTAPMEGMQ